MNLDPQAEEGSGAVLQVVARGGRSVAGQPAGSSLVKTAVMLDVITRLGGRCVRAEITHLEDSTYRAQIVLEQNGQELALTARASDAIIVAQRARAPIVVNETLLEEPRWEQTPDEATGGVPSA